MNPVVCFLTSQGMKWQTFRIPPDLSLIIRSHPWYSIQAFPQSPFPVQWSLINTTHRNHCFPVAAKLPTIKIWQWAASQTHPWSYLPKGWNQIHLCTESIMYLPSITKPGRLVLLSHPSDSVILNTRFYRCSENEYLAVGWSGFHRHKDKGIGTGFHIFS